MHRNIKPRVLLWDRFGVLVAMLYAKEMGTDWELFGQLTPAYIL